MHEMGIVLQIVEIAVDAIPSDLPNGRIKRVNLNIGKLAAVVPASLQFCFDIAVKETPLAAAELNIKEIPATARCQDCAEKWIISGPAFLCPSCGSSAIEILSGRELDVESIDIEEEPLQ